MFGELRVCLNTDRTDWTDLGWGAGSRGTASFVRNLGDHRDRVDRRCEGRTM